MYRRWTDRELNAIFNKTDGHCWYCKRKLKWSHYGDRSFAMGWEVDHVVARYNGGSDNLSNLVPACWPCNVDKGTRNAKRFGRQVEREGPPRPAEDDDDAYCFNCGERGHWMRDCPSRR
jgi:5-methylcytosine-specific restriction endonuclease McrA